MTTDERKGMNSERLSAREKQPGHDRSFVASEENFVAAACACLDPERYTVEEKPRDLRNCFPALGDGKKDYGVEPEASITSIANDRKIFFEVKKQGDAGNADERACRHHTVAFYKLMKEKYGWEYHPYVTIFCESLATNPRYTQKAHYVFEPDQYFLWKDYDQEALCRFLNERCAAWLDD